MNQAGGECAEGVHTGDTLGTEVMECDKCRGGDTKEGEGGGVPEQQPTTSSTTHTIMGTERPTSSLRSRPLLWVTKPHVESSPACSAAAQALLNGYGFEGFPRPRTERVAAVGGVTSSSANVQERQQRVKHLESVVNKVRKPMSKAYPPPPVAAKPNAAAWGAGPGTVGGKVKQQGKSANASTQKVAPRSRRTKSVGVQVEEVGGAEKGDAVKDFLRATAAFGGEEGAEEAAGGKLSQLCEEDKAKVAKLIRQVVELGQEVRRLQGELGTCESGKRELELRVETLSSAQEKQAEQHKTLTKDNSKLRKKLAHTLDLIRAYQSRFEEMSAKESLCAEGETRLLQERPPTSGGAAATMPTKPPPEAEAATPKPGPLPTSQNDTPPMSILTVRPDASVYGANSAPSTAAAPQRQWPRLLPDEFYQRNHTTSSTQAQRYSWSEGLPVGGTIAADPSTTEALSRLSALLDAQHHGVPVGFRVEDRSDEFASLGPTKPRVLKFDPNLGENGAFYFVDIDQVSPGGSPPGQQPSLTRPLSPPQPTGPRPGSEGKETHTTTTFSAEMASQTEAANRVTFRNYSIPTSRSSWWRGEEQSSLASGPQHYPLPSAPPTHAAPGHIFIPTTSSLPESSGNVTEQHRSPTHRLSAKRSLQPPEHLDGVDSEAKGEWLGGLAGEAPFAPTDNVKVPESSSPTVSATFDVLESKRDRNPVFGHSSVNNEDSLASVGDAGGAASNIFPRYEERTLKLDNYEPFRDTSPSQLGDHASRADEEWTAPQQTDLAKEGVVDVVDTTAAQQPDTSTRIPTETQRKGDESQFEPTAVEATELSEEITGVSSVVRQLQPALPEVTTTENREVSGDQARSAVVAQSSPSFSPTSGGPTMRYVTDLSGFDESLIDLVGEVESMDLGSPGSSFGALDTNNLDFAVRSARAAKPPSGSSLRRANGATDSPHISTKLAIQWPVSQQVSPMPTPHQTPRVASWLRGSIYEENDIVSTIMEAEELGRSLVPGGGPSGTSFPTL